MTVRTRFAPSPTGYLHVGGIRTALFAYLVAQQAGGQFVLRFEDTDKKREVAGSREHLIESLRALGINYDEGPDMPGDYGPYVQSERLDIYHKWAQKLIESGRAYADPYTSEQVQAFREQAQADKRAFLYRDHRPDNPPAWDGSTPLRFKSDPKQYHWHDQVMGDLVAQPENIDDFVLIKSDGYPTYDFAHIIDDLEMQISHVIRGQEFISSMPKYLNLYEALGFDMSSLSQASAKPAVRPLASKGSTLPAEPDAKSLSAHERSARALGGVAPHTDSLSVPAEGIAPLPSFAHMPHIMNEQGNKKLGKRDGAKDVLDYLRDGYLPEAMTSFIATLGWNDGTEQEVFTYDELVKKFSLDRIQRSGARFDEKRLLWMNGHFIRELSLEELYAKVESHWPDSARQASESYKKQVLALAQDRLKTLRDLPTLTDYFFHDPTPDTALITTNKQLKKLDSGELVSLIGTVHDSFVELKDWSPDSIQERLNQLLETTGQKPGTLFSLVRIATTWAPFSPQLNDTLALLGRSTTLERLDTAAELLASI